MEAGISGIRSVKESKGDLTQIGGFRQLRRSKGTECGVACCISCTGSSEEGCVFCSGSPLEQ